MTGGLGRKEEFPLLKGCLACVGYIAGTYLVLTLIDLACGHPAAFWFGLGALVMSLIAIWEAGSQAIAAGTRSKAPSEGCQSGPKASPETPHGMH